MERKNLYQILNEAKIDLQTEYDRLYYLFYKDKNEALNGRDMTLREACAANFINIPFRKTCLSLDDFDRTYGFHFSEVPKDFDINYFLTFIEYTYNLTINIRKKKFYYNPEQLYLKQVHMIIDEIGYTNANKNGIIIFVPKLPEAIALAEIVDSPISFRVIEYNHYSMKGNLEQKRNILLSLYTLLEPQRSKLKQINVTMANDLFALFNNLSLRHNNLSEEKPEYYNKYAKEMSKDDLEKWYDETYQLILLAFLELENIDRKEKIKELKTHFHVNE